MAFATAIVAAINTPRRKRTLRNSHRFVAGCEVSKIDAVIALRQPAAVSVVDLVVAVVLFVAVNVIVPIHDESSFRIALISCDLFSSRYTERCIGV